MLHDKIVAFLKLGAAQNKKKLNMGKKQQQNFWTSNYSFFYILLATFSSDISSEECDK